jgi:hypothetical protein
VLDSGSVSYERATPYLPVIGLLKAYLGIEEQDDPRGIRERVAGKLLTPDRMLEALVTPLLALLDVPVDNAAWAALDPPQRRQRTLDAVKRLLLRESQVQPLLVLFEDLHQIDSESQAVLGGVIESLPTARVLLVVSYRPEYQHAWGGKTSYTELRIDPLPPEGADQLLTALLGQDGSLEPLKRALIERTAGNPFFLEESVQTLVETRVLVGDRGAYRVAKTPPQADGRSEAWQIPATVQAILAARIDRLPPGTSRCFRRLPSSGRMCRSRSRGHRRPARGEPSPGAQPPPGGRVPLRDDLMQSLHGQPTGERFGLATVPAVYARALLARALAERGIFDEGDAHGHEAIRIAEALDHPFSVVVAGLDLAYLKSVRGELSHAAGLLERAVALCREWNVTTHTPITMAALGHVYAWSGRMAEGVSCLEQALTAYEGVGIGFHHALSMEQLGEAYLLADQVENARICADRATALARGRGERGNEAWALRLLGDIASRHPRPDVATAAAHYGAAMTLASELEMLPLVAPLPPRPRPALPGDG